MDYVPGGDLFHYIKERVRLTEGLTRWLFQQLIIAVDYMHKKNIANRDIKLENILLGSGDHPIAQLCDFGFSKHTLFESKPHSKVGTAVYFPPEMLYGKQGTYDGKCCDVWACGVVLYTMLAGNYPFQLFGEKREHLRQLVQKILELDFVFPPELHLSATVCSLLQRIFVSDPSERITIAEIQQDIWFCTHLPDAAREMNEKFIKDDPVGKGTLHGRQGIQEVLAVLEEASPKAFHMRNSDNNLEMRIKM